MHKSGVAGINIEIDTVSHFARLARCGIHDWPVTYLGIPLGGNPQNSFFLGGI